MVTNSNIGQDCHNYLGQFEAKLPVTFALCFSVHEVMKHCCAVSYRNIIMSYHNTQCHTIISSLQNDLHTSHHNGLLPQGANIGDEADNSRTKVITALILYASHELIVCSP